MNKIAYVCSLISQEADMFVRLVYIVWVSFFCGLVFVAVLTLPTVEVSVVGP